MPTLTQALDCTAADAIFNAVFERSHQFRIGLDADAARQFITRIGTYNDFEPAEVLNAVAEVSNIIVNTDDQGGDFRLEVGREASLVLYLIRYERNEDCRFSDEAINDILAVMRTVGRADEVDVEREEFCHWRKLSFRFWWD